MKIEAKCRTLCKVNRINPDAPASFQGVPGYPTGPDGVIKQWMLWITTVEIERKPPDDVFARQRAESRAKLQRIIDETGGEPKARYSCFAGLD